MPAQVCSAVWSKVLQVYDAAQASGAATKTDTQVTIVQLLCKLNIMQQAIHLRGAVVGGC